MSLFLDRGADVNQESWLNGKFPLYFAAELEDPSAMINLLMERGANIHKTSTAGATALHAACEFFNEKAIRSLLENGADLNLTDENEETPLAYMFYGNYVSNFDAAKAIIEEIVKMELENRPVNQADMLTVDEYKIMQDYFYEYMEKVTGKKTSCLGKMKRQIVSTNNRISRLLQTPRKDYNEFTNCDAEYFMQIFRDSLVFLELILILILLYSWM